MEKIRITEVQDTNFGRCMKMENGVAELMVTLDFGPRIIHYALVGHENIMYQDLTHRPIGEAFPVFGGDVLRLYGGHRLWISPEILPRCYHPDNQPVECIEIPGGMEFIAPVEEVSLVQKSIAVVMGENSGDVEIMHKITNHGQWEIEIAPWAITQLAPGGVAVIPIAGPKTGVLPNRVLALWDYTNTNDERLTLGRDYAIIRQSQEVQEAFKIGLYNHLGFGAYFNRGQAFFKHFDVTEGEFPDFGCNFETYTNNNFLENETLGCLETIGHGESVLHKEIWKIFPEETIPQTEVDAAKIIGKLLG